MVLTDIDDTTVFMATSYEPLVVGSYTRTVTPVLCGLAVPDADVFNGCARPLSQSAEFTCNSAPCERDINGLTTGLGCCIDINGPSACRAGQATADSAITRFPAAVTCVDQTP